jgi:hypothetical protein
MARDGREPWWLAQPQTLKPLLQLCDAMMPSMYLPYRLGVDVSVETNDRRNRNMVDLCQRCGPGKLVLPYVQQIYRNNGESYDRSDIPPLEQYQHAVAFTKAGASGVIFWGASRLAPAERDIVARVTAGGGRHGLFAVGVGRCLRSIAAFLRKKPLIGSKTQQSHGNLAAIVVVCEDVGRNCFESLGDKNQGRGR